MKLLYKLLISLIYAPLILLSYIVALLRLLYTLIVLFTWAHAEEIHDFMFEKINDKIQKLKE